MSMSADESQWLSVYWGYITTSMMIAVDIQVIIYLWSCIIEQEGNMTHNWDWDLFSIRNLLKSRICGTVVKLSRRDGAGAEFITGNGSEVDLNVIDHSRYDDDDDDCIMITIKPVGSAGSTDKRLAVFMQCTMIVEQFYSDELIGSIEGYLIVKCMFIAW
jgi:hypothetical protein